MSNGTVEQKTSNHSDVSLSDLKVSNFASLNSFLIDELEVNLSINLSDDLKNIIKTYLSEYESLNQRKLEEKDSVISQLKQSLLDLTEKRFRASIQNGSSSLPNENIEFLINEKEAKINQLLDQLSENERDITKLKQTINSQDDVILSLNSNIYELKNSNQTVLKAKQESFKLMTEDLNSKQKLIEEQTETIRELKEKTKRLEEELKKAHNDLEKRLNEKQTDLQIKIAQFEANLREGKIYFEDVLAEKSKEINRLKIKLESLGQSGEDEIPNGVELNLSNINKFDSDNIKNIKGLYEHQIDILKVKIEMLEKTCTNYQQGIKEMNKNFGIQQLSDEVNSIQTFKDLMQDLQKTNVNLETEKIDLQVNNSKLQSQLDQTRIEKENLNKKFHTADQLNQRLSQEKQDLDTHYRSLLNSKESELAEINQKFHHLNIEYEQLSQDNSRLAQISLEYEQLKTTNQELTDHYEQLCHQATDIVNGNQMLNEQVESSHVQIEQLRSQVNDLQLEVDHLSNCNSELNTQKVNYELKVEDLEIKMQEIQPELDELEALRRLNLDINSLNEQLKDLRLELEDKNELIEQLNQAKEFLAENNCKLLTNNIKIQLFVESLGLDQSEIENSQRVKEYDDLMDKVSKYESEILGLRIQLEEIRFPAKTGLDKEIQFDGLTEEMDQLKERLTSNEKLTLKLKAKLKQMLKESAKCQENEAQTEDGEYVQFLIDFGAKMAQEKIEKDVEESLNALKCDVQRLLLSKELKSDKSLNTSQDFDYRDQIFSLEAQLNQKMNQMGELMTRCEQQQEIIDSMDISVVAELKNRIELMQNDLRIKDEQIDALSDWGSSVPQKSQANTDKTDQIEVSEKEKELVVVDLEKYKQEFDQEIKNANSLKEKLESRIKELEGEVRIKDEQIDALSDWGSSFVNKSEDQKDDGSQIESLEAKINGLKEEIDVLKKEKEVALSDLEKNKEQFNQEIRNLNNLREKQLLMIEELEFKIIQLENELKIKNGQIDALSDWGSSFVNKSEDQKDDGSQIESLEAKINGLNEEIGVLKKEKEVALSDLEKNKEGFEKEIQKLTQNKDKYMEDLELKIGQLENEVKVKDEQIDALSDWGSSVPNKTETEKDNSSQIEFLEANINGLKEEIDVLKKEKEVALSDLEKNKEGFDQEIKNLNNLKEKQLFMIGELELKIKELENEVKIKNEQLEAVSDWAQGSQNKSENEDQVEGLKNQVLDLQVDLKAKQELIESLEIQLKNVDQELEAVKCNSKHLESELAQSQASKQETRLENVQLLGNSASSDETIELKAHINQMMIELSIKNDQLVSLESVLNEQKIESQKMIEKLTFESESWKKKYESMRLKALALRDKCKKFELGQCLDDGRASPSNSSKSSMDSSSLAEHLFHNLQAEYKEFKRTHEDQINELSSLLTSAQTHLDQYKQDFNEEKINHVHRMYTDQLKQYELNFESIQSQNDHLKLELDQLTDKYSHIEKQNLKLKAKLKQVLAKSKEDHFESQKISSDTKLIQAGLDEALEKKIVVQMVHAEAQTIPLELFSTQCQTEDQELECLRLQNEQYKCLIEDLEKNQFSTETKVELDELREKVKVVQDQNLKLKAKLKQVMGQNQKVAKIDSECQTELESLVQKECEVENLLKKIFYLEELAGQKEKMNQDMRCEISGLKDWIEKQRSDYENQIGCLNAELVGKETNLVQIKEELCCLRSQSEISMVSALPSSLMSESVVMDETASSASSNLENQLKFCHEKCEKVVAKLGLLRKQNESLNSKIKTIKSMIVS